MVLVVLGNEFPPFLFAHRQLLPKARAAIASIDTAYGSADIGQNDFLEIHGTNLAVANAGPSSLTNRLGGVSVTVNGRAP
jgi:hypothetical protein